MLGFLLLERGVELAIHRRNARLLRARGAVWAGADGFGLLVLAQVLFFVLVATEASWAPYAGLQPWTVPLVLALALAQALRYWCIATLGQRWTVRVVTVADAPRIVGGPYRFFPHPNYVAVMVEAVALPLAFGAWVALLVAAPLQFLALWRRVRIEERALREAAQRHAAGR